MICHVDVFLKLYSVFSEVTEKILGNNGLCQKNCKRGAVFKFCNAREKINSESVELAFVPR